MHLRRSERNNFKVSNLSGRQRGKRDKGLKRSKICNCDLKHLKITCVLITYSCIYRNLQYLQLIKSHQLLKSFA